MITINYREDAKTYHGAFGVAKERVPILLHKMELVVHDLHKPKGPGDPKAISGDYFLKEYMKIAETDAELLFLVFQSGLATARTIDYQQKNIGGLLESLLGEEAPKGEAKPAVDEEDVCPCPSCVARRRAGVPLGGVPLPPELASILKEILKHR